MTTTKLELPMAQEAPPPAALTPGDVEEALARRVRRFINAHAGDVYVQDVTPEGDVHLGFEGACARCPALSATFAVSVLPVLKSVPGVRNVTAEGINMSEAALERVARMFGPTTKR
jgi:Fe-S cluster biogenesis protein NfuA